MHIVEEYEAAVVKSSVGWLSTRRIQISIRPTDCGVPSAASGGARPALRLLEPRHRVAQGSQPFQRIGDLQQVLPLGIAQRQKLRQSKADPTGIVVALARPVAPR